MRVQRFQSVPHLLSLLVLAVVLTVVPARTLADAQVSLRGTLEMGQRKLDGKSEFIIGPGLRGDAMFGPARPRAFRLGPAFELRTMDFATVEAAVGGGVLLPLFGELNCPLGLTGLVGTAARRGGTPSGPMGIGTVTWGFRGYNYSSWYGYGINVFFSGRKLLGSEHSLVEWTGGIEMDMAFTVLIPARAIMTWLKGGDPLED